MVQWDFSLDSASNGNVTTSRRPPRVVPSIRRKKTSSRPLVEPKYNSHLLHAGSNRTSITRNGKKIRIRKVKKDWTNKSPVLTDSLIIKSSWIKLNCGGYFEDFWYRIWLRRGRSFYSVWTSNSINQSGVVFSGTSIYFDNLYPFTGLRF